jgi:hypothetical protein
LLFPNLLQTPARCKEFVANQPGNFSNRFPRLPAGSYMGANNAAAFTVTSGALTQNTRLAKRPPLTQNPAPDR